MSSPLIQPASMTKKTLVPACTHCGKDATKMAWLDREVPPDSGTVFRIFYCGQEDCRKIHGVTLLGQRGPLVEVPGIRLPAGFDPGKIDG